MYSDNNIPTNIAPLQSREGMQTTHKFMNAIVLRKEGNLDKLRKKDFLVYKIPIFLTCFQFLNFYSNSVQILDLVNEMQNWWKFSESDFLPLSHLC